MVGTRYIKTEVLFFNVLAYLFCKIGFADLKELQVLVAAVKVISDGLKTCFEHGWTEHIQFFAQVIDHFYRYSQYGFVEIFTVGDRVRKDLSEALPNEVRRDLVSQ